MKNKIAIFFVVAFFLTFLSFKNVLAICANNFSADFSYQGQSASPDGPFTDSGNLNVPVDNYFNAVLKLNAIGQDLQEEGENIELMLAIDRSSSMDECADGTFATRIIYYHGIWIEIPYCPQGDAFTKMVKAKEALKEVADIFIEKNDFENRVGLVSFSENVYINQRLDFLETHPSANPYEELKSEIEYLNAFGNTNIGGALSTANNHLKQLGDAEKRWFIILASDGEHTEGTNPYSVIPNVDARTTVYTVGIGKDADQETLKDIAEDSGTKEGKYFYADPTELSEVFKEIMDDILIPFEAKNIKLTFSLASIANGLSFQESFPPSTLETERLIWDDLDNMNNGSSQEFSVIMKNENAFGSAIPINKDPLIVNYIEVDENGVSHNCTESVPINVINIINLPKCLGNQPDPNSDFCPGDNQNLLKDTPIELVSSCGPAKCEYICNAGFKYVNGVCTPPINGICGSAKVFYCSNIPSSGLCSSGTATLPLYSETNKQWEWICKGENEGRDSGTCSAEDYCQGNYYEVNP